MKKLYLALLCIVSLALVVACGGKSGEAAQGNEPEGGNTSELPAGKWPAAVYEKYGIPEFTTKGKIVFTEFGADESYQYRVMFKGVTREEVLAWVKTLKDKGFRIHQRDMEYLENSKSNYDIMLYQPEEKKDMRLRLNFDFDKNMDFEYYEEEPNPAFEVVTRDDEQYIEYNFDVSLNPIETEVATEGSFDALGVKAEDLAGIPNVRVVELRGNETGGAMNFIFYADHEMTEADFDALHNKVADVLEAKGATFVGTMSGKEYNAEQLKAEKLRGYTVVKDGKKFMMMARTDDGPGEFGCSITFSFMLSK